MTTTTLYLFSDTNLLLQCRPLEELDWARWAAFAEVRVVISNPVLREIDYRKNKGNDRVSSRARAASSMFRAMPEIGTKVIRENDPKVTLSVEPALRPSPNVQDRLNYDERDDQLIGILYEFVSHQGGVDARLLTHDTTPMFMARSLELSVEVIPEAWLLPPEKTEREKEFAQLKGEVARLKKSEPEFQVRCFGPDRQEITQYIVQYTRFEKLTDGEVEQFMSRIVERFPVETKFGSSEPAERPAQVGGRSFSAWLEEFVPATQEEIERYRDETYPKWLEACRDILQALHRKFQQALLPLQVDFHAENIGTRPAVDALVTITGKGGLLVRPPTENTEESNGNKASKQNSPIRIPSPPVAPNGRWRSKNLSAERLTENLLMLDRLSSGFLGPSGFGRSLFEVPEVMLPSPLLRTPSRDSNAFYYKPHQPLKPQEQFSLECDQWRHGDDEEVFSVQLGWRGDADKVSGALEFRVHASNLSDPISLLLPVRIEICRVSAALGAKDLIDSLIAAGASSLSKLRFNMQGPPKQPDGEA